MLTFVQRIAATCLAAPCLAASPGFAASPPMVGGAPAP